MPKFSIIIPAYNSSSYITRALDSVANQTFKDYECLVICDSCTDITEKIVSSYGFYTEEVNFHADGLTRNRGLDRAEGEYVLFMDDDDWWLHEFVLEQINDKLIEVNPDVLCFSFIFKNVGYATPLSLKYSLTDTIINNGWHWIAVWNKCWRRESIGSTRFSSEVTGASDVLFHIKMMQKKNLKIVDWDMPMYYYNYMRKGSITERHARNQ